MMKLYNTLTRKIEDFVPLDPPRVGMYACGPTVYHFATIANFRTYITSDILLRTLKANGYEVNYVVNITDVGHLTGDNLGDADIGEDKIEKAAKKEGKTVWDIANFYTNAFLKDFEKLNLIKPNVMPKATDHIKEQIELVKKLEGGGFTYKITDGIYFDTVAFEKKTGKKYGELSTMDEIKEGARVEQNPEKKNPRDFALWKFSEKPGERQMEWESPWGLGFPGWHIECSAMSMKYLGETLDIHGGGEDLRQTHHPNEIAQSEAVTGKLFVRHWVHGAFILVDGKRMGKSLGNAYLVDDLEKRGFDPLVLRYLYLTGNYREIFNFTWESLEAAQNALNNLRDMVRDWEAPKIGCAEYEERFMEAVNNDLNPPQALAIMWELVKSDYPSSAKAESLLKMDKVLGLKLDEYIGKPLEIPAEVQKLVNERENARKAGNFEKSDKLRHEIKKLGFEVEDTPDGPKTKKA